MLRGAGLVTFSWSCCVELVLLRGAGHVVWSRSCCVEQVMLRDVTILRRAPYSYTIIPPINTQTRKTIGFKENNWFKENN